MRKKSFIFFTGSGTGSADHQQVQEVGTCEILEIQTEGALQRALNPVQEHLLAQSGRAENGVSRKEDVSGWAFPWHLGPCFL